MPRQNKPEKPACGCNVYNVLKDLHKHGYKVVIVTNESVERFINEKPIRNTLLKKAGRIEAFCRPCDFPIQV
eukprot:m.137963 g.137963  ORF g.137963 m.137963 type:complete len:72 (-) comp17013_c0_seq3:98-313(-)